MTAAPVRLLLARHGETEWNSRDLVQGSSDVALSEGGVKQAEQLAERLSDEPIDHIYCSDLERSRRTAEIVGERHGVAPTVEPSLAEQDFGEWDGETLEELHGMLDRTGTDWTEWNPEGGERWSEFCDRVLTAVDRITSEHAQDSVLIAAHGGVNKAVLSRVKFADIGQRSRIEQDTACLNELQYRPEGSEIRRINDTSHLREGE
jgi:broad specificity phosphatase PhoE